MNAHWSVCKSSVKKLYDKDIKGYCYSCDGLGKVSFPKDPKQRAYLVQNFLILQIFAPVGSPISIELSISDLTQNHRRFFISSRIKESNVTALHASLPFNNLRRGIWNNVVFNMGELVLIAYERYRRASRVSHLIR
jgi:Protein of unknown function (DUF667)